MTGPPLSEGAVLVDGEQIIAVGSADDLASSAERRHHIDGVLLPGLVDGHTCLEQSDAREIARPGPFHQWLRAVGGYVSMWGSERWARSARRGVQDALRHGVTAVVDTVVRGPAVPAASRAGLRGHSLVQVMNVDRREQDDVIAALRHSLDRPARGRTVGIAPHSPYMVSAGVLQALAALAVETGRPLQIRAAESNQEIAALRTAEGPVASFVRDSGLQAEWLDEGGVGSGVIGYLSRLGVLDVPGVQVVHAVWADLADARTLAAAGATVVCCPRANHMLGVGDAPLERFAETGVALALGTAGAGASGDADILAEAAAWVAAARRRDVFLWPSPAGPIPLEEAAIRLATVDGARAVGLGDVAGVLTPGRRADLVGVSLQTTVETVYRDLVAQGPGRQVVTVLGGVRRSRRADADVPWPSLEEWKDAV